MENSLISNTLSAISTSNSLKKGDIIFVDKG